MFDGSRVLAGPGTLYVAPIGTTEPTSVTGAWPAGWILLGYTEQGSSFENKPKFQAIEVEEELYAVRQAATGADVSVAFSLAETTARNLAINLNAGVATPGSTSNSGTNADGSIWVEPVDLGTEVRVMLGWDFLPKGSTTQTNTLEPLTRLIVRQCLNTGGIKREARKGNKFATWNAMFSAEKPTTLEPFRFLLPAILAA